MQQANEKDAYGNTWKSEVGDDGEFVRHQTTFRDQIRADGTTDFAPESGRYHLYVSYACPWAHRTLITRKLKGLDDAISFGVVSPLLPKTGWSFDDLFEGATKDTVNDFQDLREAYLTSNPQFEGAVAIASEQLERRDGIAIEGAASVDFAATEDCQLLAIDIPMQ